MQLIPITIIFIIPYIYSAILNKKTTYTIPLTFLTLIITTIIFGYLNILKYVDIFLIIASLIALFYIYHKKLYKNKMFFNYQTLMFLIFCIFITILNYKFTIFEWDAFSHWATAAKYMIQNNVFFNQSSYPPGITSLQYVYTKLAFGSFNESYLVNALLMFTMSLFMPLFDLIKNKEYRLEYDQAKTIKETAEKGSKIYFLDTNNTPYAYYLARYENIDMLFANPIYSKDINEEIINKYDYLYVYSYNEELKEKFDELKEFTLYKIEKNKFKEVSNEK